jgi:predicted branched-subunit amino acid permease
VPRSLNLRRGLRAGVPFVLPTLVLGISFGVVARPIMGPIAPIVMSVVVFGGGAQFASLSVLAAGGAVGAAIIAGLLVNARFLVMGFAVGPSLPGSALSRAAQGQALVDASFAVASGGDGHFDRGLLIGATLPQAAAWIGGTAVGVLAGPLLGDPRRFGLDAIFAAFYLFLAAGEAHSRRGLAAALAGAAITLALMPIAPPGVPIIVAASAALLGLRRP